MSDIYLKALMVLALAWVLKEDNRRTECARPVLTRFQGLTWFVLSKIKELWRRRPDLNLESRDNS